MYALTDYNYDLPEGLIAQAPVAQRDRSRLFCLDRRSGHWEHGYFDGIAERLDPGDVLVANNTKVINGRLLGRKESGGKVEVLILDYAQGVMRNRFECMVRASKRPVPGGRLLFEGGLQARVQAVKNATITLSFTGDIGLDKALERYGRVPLPPYIRRDDTPFDRTAYQTIYAENKGAIAAPTAGLHFTKALLDRLIKKGVKIVYLTLHVGYGTFVPVRVDDIRQHPMHAEWFSLGDTAAVALTAAKRRGNRVVAVGTTSMRTLEFCTDDSGAIAPQTGMCDLFIYPGYEFKMVDVLVTNFHLPQSTLLMLVSAFAGRQKILRAYAEAVKEK